MEAVGSFETLTPIYQTTQCHIPEGHNFHIHQWEPQLSWQKKWFCHIMWIEMVRLLMESTGHGSFYNAIIVSDYIMLNWLIIMNLKGSGEKQLWPNWGTILAFVWRHQGNLWKICQDGCHFSQYSNWALHKYKSTASGKRNTMEINSREDKR
jgi:hypothetical protein